MKESVPRLETYLRYGALFGLIGVVFNLGAFFIGIAASGLERVPMPWAIVWYLGYWPDMALQFFLPNIFFHQFREISLFGFPEIGWTLAGVIICGARRALTAARVKRESRIT